MKKTGNALRVALATLGCKVNQYESAALTAAFEDWGFQVLPFTAEAECYVINTCTVTNRTDYQSRQLIRRAARSNPEALIIVTGCYAQTNAKDLADIHGITLIAGNREKAAMPRIIADLWEERRQAAPATPAPRTWVSPFPEREDPLQVGEVRSFPGHTRAFLKIQDGCNAFCSYCIVPYARGRSRSLAPEEVLRRLERFAAAGYREVVLTGIHLGCYGQDFDPSTNFASLLRRIEEQQSITRLRLSSLEPLEITETLLALLKTAVVICPHLHIPLQSGDDTVLSRMNRHYDGVFFKALVGKILAARPETALGLDVMVGFPGEDEQAFQRTFRLIEDLPVAYLHVFPYSKRPGTPAATMMGQVREEDKKRRAEHLRGLGQEKRRAFMERFLGQRLQVLIEGRIDKKTCFYKGFSQHYIPVSVVNGSAEWVNRVVSVQAVEIGEGGLIGKIMHE